MKQEGEQKKLTEQEEKKERK